MTSHPPTRAQRLAMPLARDIVRQLATENGGCVRSVQLRRTDLHTGQVQQVLVPVRAHPRSVCPSCAERNKQLRAAQCREGWHLDTEPPIGADEPDDTQKWWTDLRAEAQQLRDPPPSAARTLATRRAHNRAGRGNRQRRHPRQGHARPASAQAPDHPAAPGHA